MKRCTPLWGLLVICAFCLPSLAQEPPAVESSIEAPAESPKPVPSGPEAVIDGPEDARPGTLVVLDAEKSVGGGHRWLALHGAVPLSEDFFTIDSDGRKLYFAVPVEPDAVYVFVLSVAQQDQSALEHHTVKVGEPGPGPGPNPNPNPGPVPVKGLHVLVVYESEELDDIPHGQASIFTSRPVRDYLDSHCAKVGTDPQWHFFDKDVDTTDLTDDWKEVFKRTEGKELPWIIVASEKASFEGKLPENAEKMLELLKKYGGE